MYICAHSSIGSGNWTLCPPGRKAGACLTDPVIGEIAKAHGRSPAQIIFAWHHHHKTIVLCQTSKPERLPENISFFDVKLSEEDVKKIDALDSEAKLYDPFYIDGFGWNSMPYYN